MSVLKRWYLPILMLGLIAGTAYMRNSANALTMTKGRYYCFSETNGKAEEEAVKQSDGTYKCANGSTDVRAFTGDEGGGDDEEEVDSSTGGSGDTVILTACDSEDGVGKIMCVLKIGLDVLTIGIGVLAVLGIVIVGIQYLTAGGNEEQTRKAKRRMFEIVIGLVAYVLLYALLSWLLPGGIGS